MRTARTVGLFMLLMLSAPAVASALQLTWSSGGSQLTFSEATRCTLLLHVSGSEVRLPAEWRLMWTSDSTLSFVAATGACLLQAAEVSEIDAPSTPADSAANQLTAHYCSTDNETATLARQVLWDGRGRGGVQAASGVYFLRLTYAGGARISKIVMLR